MMATEAPLGDGRNAIWTRGAQAYWSTGKATMSKALDLFVAKVPAHMQHFPQGRQNILDIASGPGEPGLSLAAELPGSTVTCTDYSSGMVQLAEQRAKDSGLHNTRFQVASGDDLSAFPDGSFAAVTCNQGLFVMDWRRALAEWARVLQPGGLVAFTVWQSGDKQQFMFVMGGVVMGLVKSGLAKPPTMKLENFTDPAPLLAELEALGFEEVQSSEHNICMELSEHQFRTVMLANPISVEWIEANCGADQEAFQADFYQRVKAASQQHGILQPDGTFVMSRMFCHYVSGRKRG